MIGWFDNVLVAVHAAGIQQYGSARWNQMCADSNTKYLRDQQAKRATRKAALIGFVTWPYRTFRAWLRRDYI